MHINFMPAFGMATHKITARDTDDHQFPLLTLQRLAKLGGAETTTQTKIIKEPQTGDSFTQVQMVIETPKLPSGKLSTLDRTLINASCPPGHPSRRSKGNLVSHQIEMRKPGLLAWALGGRTKQVYELKPTDYERNSPKPLSA